MQENYDLKGATTQVRYMINSGQDYLNDFAFWFYVDWKKADGNPLAEVPFNTINGLHKLIRSVEIKVDGRQILYLDHARFLLDMMIKKKKSPDEHLIHKFEDFPLEYRAFTGAVTPNVVA